MKLETERLTILDCAKSDGPRILEIRNSDFVRRYNLYQIETLDQLYFEMDNNDMYKIVLKENNLIIGVIKLAEDTFRYHINCRWLIIYLDENYASKGYMSEALGIMFPELFKKYDLLTGYIFEENKASIRLSEKMGWKIEGVMREAVKDFNGVIHNLVFLSCTKEDFKTI